MLTSRIKSVWRPEAFVFDMDGVLVDSERPLLAVLQRLLVAAGVQPRACDLRQVCGRPAGFLRLTLSGYLGEGPDLEAFLERYAAAREQLIEDGAIRAFDAASVVLSLLKHRGVGLAVATSTHAEPAFERLERTGLLHWFDHVVTGDQVVSGKPAPDIFLLAAERLGVPAKACLVVEDSPAGIEAARNAGMMVFAIATTFAVGELGMADRVFGTLNDLHSFLSEQDRSQRHLIDTPQR